MYFRTELNLWILKSYLTVTFYKGKFFENDWWRDFQLIFWFIWNLNFVERKELFSRKCLCNKKLRPNAQSSLVVGIQTSKACFTLKILLQRIKCKPHFTFEFLSNVGSNKRSLYRMGCVLIISPLWNLIQKQKEEIQWSCAQNWHICIMSITFCFNWEISL